MKGNVLALVPLLASCEAPPPAPPPPAPGGLEALAREDPLVPSPDVDAARRVRALAGEVETALLAVDRVSKARVLLSLPGRLAPGTARAAVVVRWEGGAPPLSEETVRRLTAAAVPGLEPAAVDVVLSAAAPAATPACDLVRVGPLTVTRGSRGPLLGIVGGLAGLCLLLALWLVRRGLSRRPGAPRGWRG